MAETSELQIEIGGFGAGEFDMLNVLGDLDLQGSLSVDLIDGFELGDNQYFSIINIAGQRTGLFNGLNDGDLVGRFGSQDLFITYSGGTGNDTGLFTVSAVPEPSAAVLALLALSQMALRRRKSLVL